MDHTEFRKVVVRLIIYLDSVSPLSSSPLGTSHFPRQRVTLGLWVFLFFLRDGLISGLVHSKLSKNHFFLPLDPKSAWIVELANKIKNKNSKLKNNRPTWNCVQTPNWRAVPWELSGWTFALNRHCFQFFNQVFSLPFFLRITMTSYNFTIDLEAKMVDYQLQRFVMDLDGHVVSDRNIRTNPLTSLSYRNRPTLVRCPPKANQNVMLFVTKWNWKTNFSPFSSFFIFSPPSFLCVFLFLLLLLMVMMLLYLIWSAAVVLYRAAFAFYWLTYLLMIWWSGGVLFVFCVCVCAFWVPSLCLWCCCSFLGSFFFFCCSSLVLGT